MSIILSHKIFGNKKLLLTKGADSAIISKLSAKYKINEK